MALSTTGLTNRIDAELKILGGFVTAVKTSIVVDAVNSYLRKVDKPLITASIAVTVATGKGPYSIPSTIEKDVIVYDASGNPKSYSKDSITKKITFAEDISANETRTMYGTPTDIRTNLNTVVAAINPNHEDVLFAYCRAYAHKQKNSNAFATELQAADKLAKELRQNINMSLNADSRTISFRDVNGNLITDAGNAEGLTPNISDYLESDLR